MTLRHRTQILLDDERHRLLRELAAESGRSVGDLVREAIDRTLASDRQRERHAERARRQAVERLLGAEPLPVDDWPQMERELEEMYERGK